jgi:uncharacterized protein (UPF0335 family)
MNVSADQLRLYLERIERLEEEKRGISEDIKDVYSEAKSSGFDVKVMRQIVKLRRMETHVRQVTVVRVLRMRTELVATNSLLVVAVVLVLTKQTLLLELHLAFLAVETAVKATLVQDLMPPITAVAVAVG